ncbi:MAG: hypothetical protein QME68_00110 [Elusimicrobiota bacterium]|nr:hypothetical protein [Elusimicrobiota bacterium]
MVPDIPAEFIVCVTTKADTPFLLTAGAALIDSKKSFADLEVPKSHEIKEIK